MEARLLLNIAIGKTKQMSIKRNFAYQLLRRVCAGKKPTWKSPKFEADAYKKLTEVN